MSRLSGKRALVTGGTSGIGLETAKQFIAEGAFVAITGRSESALQEASLLLNEDVLLLRSDASLLDEQHSVALQLSKRWGSLDIVFVNAGDVTHRPMGDWDIPTYEKLMDTNLKGPFFLLQALFPILQNPSSVILCGSVSAHIGLPMSSVYSASKAGLLSLARTLSGEWIKRGIRVNGLSPGPTETPALQKLGLGSEAQASLREDIRKLVPLGRLGTPAELAKAAIFLASDESTFIVGTEVLVDGGVGNL